jgi:CYTH domain-containing protein
MKLDKTFRTELNRSWLIEGLPAPLTRASEHIQIFDNYIHETRLRLRVIRFPETKEWTYILQQRESNDGDPAEWKISEINLSEAEYEHFKVFEGNEIRKNRYFYEFNGQRFEFDVYLGPLWGLNKARLGFSDRSTIEGAASPQFALAEITNEKFFDDANLVRCTFEDVQRKVEKLLKNGLRAS